MSLKLVSRDRIAVEVANAAAGVLLEALDAARDRDFLRRYHETFQIFGLMATKGGKDLAAAVGAESCSIF